MAAEIDELSIRYKADSNSIFFDNDGRESRGAVGSRSSKENACIV